MFSFLKGNGKKDSRDLEQVIFDVAEHHRNEDFHLLYRLMSAREVYLPVDRATLPSSAHPGVPYQTQATDRLAFKTVTIPNQGNWASAATFSSHASLAAGYVGMPWPEYLQMVLKIADIRGAILQGKTSWIALDKERISYVLGLEGSNN